MTWHNCQTQNAPILKKNDKLGNQIDTLILYNTTKNIRHLKITAEMSNTQYAKWKLYDLDWSATDILLDQYQVVSDLATIKSFYFYHLVWENSPTTNLPRWQIIFGFKDFTGQTWPVIEHVKKMFIDFNLEVEVQELKTFEEIKEYYTYLFTDTSCLYQNHELYCVNNSTGGYGNFVLFLKQYIAENCVELLKIVAPQKVPIKVPYGNYVPKQVIEEDEQKIKIGSCSNLLVFYCQKNNWIINKKNIWQLKPNTKCTYEYFKPNNYFTEQKDKMIEDLCSWLPIEVSPLKVTPYFDEFWNKAVEYFIQQPGSAVNENWIEFKNGIYIYDQAKFIPDKNICQELNQYCSKYFDTDWTSSTTQVA